MKNFKQIKAIEAQNKQRILEVCPHVTDVSGIYILKRYENEFKYAYVGQAKKILTRLAGHLAGFQHIDLSIKKHGLSDGSANPCGWRIEYIPCHIDQLDNMERSWILALATHGYQMRNKTSGGQGEGKAQIADFKPPKTYRDGLKQGYENARKEVANWFDKYLDVTTKWNGNTTGHLNRRLNALEKFKQFLEGGNNE